MKRHDQVCSRSTTPCTGYVVRVGADWVDVEWHAGLECVYRQRCGRGDVVPIAMQLANAVRLANSGIGAPPAPEAGKEDKP